jgi:hypothetical protein
LVAAIPAGGTVLTHTLVDDPMTTVERTSQSDVDSTDLIVVTNQGRWGAEASGNLEIINRSTNEVVYEHNVFRRYMDVDQIGPHQLLVVAGVPEDNGYPRRAFVLDWVNDTIIWSHPVPGDTHDVDWLGDGRLAVADKAYHSVYVTNVTTGDREWTYNFSSEYGATDGGERDGDWTHLNDVDFVQNGSGVLVSPRNFNRVMLIDRDTKRVQWSIGEQNNTSIIHRQHNPTLLTSSPPTILIADSRNHRIVEYVRQNGTWRPTWAYAGSLAWPRDADRLPNGNTAITDTNNNRVLIVSESKEIAWEYETSSPHPYDIELLAYDNEPQGPAINESSSTAKDSPETSLRAQLARIEVVAVWTGFFPSWFSLWDTIGMFTSVLSFVGAGIITAVRWVLSDES